MTTNTTQTRYSSETTLISDLSTCYYCAMALLYSQRRKKKEQTKHTRVNKSMTRTSLLQIFEREARRALAERNNQQKQNNIL